MSFENIKAFIFDLDGTLIDTEKIYREIWPITIDLLGHKMTDEMYLSLRSLGRPYAPAKFKEWYGEDFDYDEARRIRKGFFDERVEKNGIQLKKGALELLSFLHDQNIVTAIATATDLDRASNYMKMTGLYEHFDKIISATMVKLGKPSPDVYLYACEQLGFKPSECVAVEDSPNGIKSAYTAGLSVIMVPDMSDPTDEIMPMLTGCYDSLNEIIKEF